MLNYLWLGFFVAAFIAGLGQWLLGGDREIFTRLMQATFDMGRLSVEIALGLVGVLCFWLGLLRIAERSGLAQALARLLAPLFRRLMPGVPAGDPALASITMNLAANMMGLDNAATPMGIRAMEQLQKLNPLKDTASNAQILFLVLNTSAVTLFPVTILLYRAQQGAADPAAVFIPILLATSASTLVGLLSVALVQRIRLRDPVILAYFGGFGLLLAGLMAWLSGLPADQMAEISGLLGNFILFTAIIAILVVAAWRRVPVYEAFVDGAKEGFAVAVRIIPYLVAMLVAIGVLRASGLLDAVTGAIAAVVHALGLDSGFVEALPTALMKPFSGSGARAMMLETMQAHGVDSFPATLAAIVQGSTETTFYVLAVYFGAVGIRKVRHALACGLLADLAGIVAAILVAYWFFG